MHITRILTLFLALAVVTTARADIDWPTFMANQDMTWTKLPGNWYDGPFMGNGALGTYIIKEPGKNAIRVDIGNSMVHDHRTDDRGIYGRCRLLIGYFLLEPVGEITGCDLRLSLYDATTTGTIHTTAGDIHLRAFVASEAPYIVVETETTGGEKNFKWQFCPEKADSPRQLNAIARKSQNHFKQDYVSNPGPEVSENARGGICIQPLLQGGATATAWRILGKGDKRTLVITNTHTYPTGNAADIARRDIDIKAGDIPRLYKEHTEWWHRYCRQSFVSLPDKRMENFYWAQIYKLGSATRPGKGIADNQGPWLVLTPWPNAWWNLNVQLSYWPVTTSNHTELGQVLVDAVRDNMDNLIANVPTKYRHDSAALPVATDFDMVGTEVPMPGGKGHVQIGNLPWLCHNLWQQYRYTMDTDVLRDALYPALKRAVNLYLHFVYEGEDGRLHLPETYSPEYGSAPDCNYDLALLRWGCQTLIETAGLLGDDDGPDPRWQEVVDRLADYPSDPEQGMLIGAGVPYEKSHRHFSHMLMFYPLHTVNADMPGAREQMERTVDRWFSIPGNILGFSYTGASLMHSAFGDGNSALDKLNGLFTKYLRPNTLYKESGPVIETPLSGAQAILEMLLQSWGGKIRVFPAMPDAWAAASFADLRAEGAFLVSATRLDGKTTSITVRSLAGEPCVLVTDMADPRIVGGGTLRRIADNTYELDLARGKSATITPGGVTPATPAPVAGEGANTFGLK